MFFWHNTYLFSNRKKPTKEYLQQAKSTGGFGVDGFEKDGQLDKSKWSFENGVQRNEKEQWYQSENTNCKSGYPIITRKIEHKPNPATKQVAIFGKPTGNLLSLLHPAL